MAKNVEFDILARDRASNTFDNVAKSSDGLGSKLGKLSKGAMVGVGVAAAGAAVGGIAALGAAMLQGVKDAASYQTLANKTAAVLKSTGNASHQSVKGIQERAGALESLSGVDEEIIINGQNVLATFTNIRDGVGKGNDIFNQATTAALNMSTALGQDMQSSVVQLGKALNNPIKGVTALQRVGVSFTDSQKKQIKTLVESGKTMQAQKLILGELNKEFGGAAKAAGQGFDGAMARAKDSVQDAFRAIGMLLLPVVTKLANFIATHAGPAITKISDAFRYLFTDGADGAQSFAEIVDNVFGNSGRLVKPLRIASQLFKDLVNGVRAMFAAFRDGDRTSDGIVGGFERVGIALRAVAHAAQQFGGWLKSDLWPALQKGYQTIMPALRQAFQIVASAFKSSGSDGKGFGDILKKVGAFITGVLIPVVAKIATYALPLLAVGLRNNIMFVKVLWSGFQTLMGVVGRVISFILGRFADLAGMWANVLRALSHVPGFGWARDAANKLDRAAGRANALASAINRIPNSKNIVVTLHEQTVRVSTAGNPHGNIPKNARGTRNFPGGLSWVGEQGPELVYLPKGSDVYSNGESMAMARGGRGSSSGGSSGGGDQTIVVQLTLDGRVVQQSLLKLKRQGGVNLGLA